MWRLDVAQNQWLMLAYFGGVILVLFTILIFFAAWRPREGENLETEDDYADTFSWAWAKRYMPWFLAVLTLGVIGWEIGYLIMMAITPPIF